MLQTRIPSAQSADHLKDSEEASKERIDSQNEVLGLVLSQVETRASVPTISYTSDASGQTRVVHRTQQFFVRGRISRQIDISLDPSSGAVYAKVESLFDTRGRVKTQKVYDASGRRVLQMNFKYDTSGRVVSIQKKGSLPPALLPNAGSIAPWFSQNQAATATGLVVSHPDDTDFIYHEGHVADWAKIYANTQGYTYNEALAGITMLNAGNLAGAKSVFDFYYSEFQKEKDNFSGFWTVYNVDPNFQWKRYEWRKGMGENAWFGLFCLWYESRATDPAEKQKALELSTALARWIATKVPHLEGAVAMGPLQPEAQVNFGTLYSTENMLDYGALLRELLKKSLSASDAALFSAESTGIKDWLRTKAYDSSQGLFRRGGKLNATSGLFEWDSIMSLDVDSWGIAAIGVSALKNDFGIDVEALARNTASRFALLDDNRFGANPLLSKGFDFADATNAAAIGRSGLKWVEGTNQMILAYRLLSNFYASSNRTKSQYYAYLADTFSIRNTENQMTSPQGTSYVYADRADTQIYDRTGNWKTFVGRSAASSAWVYFSIRNINPFEIR